MTREEAIEFGNMWLQVNEYCKDSNIYEFFQIAIEALKQESILDKIKVDIEQLRTHKAQYITSDCKVCIDSQTVLDILNKYKAESG